MPLLFSYGTLQQESVQVSTFGRALPGSPDAIVGFTTSTVRLEDPDAVAALGEQEHVNVVFDGRETSRVHGMVFEVTDEELVAADAYEMEASYRRVVATLASGPSAWVYTHQLR
jgi:hypothetical protein